MTTSDKTPTREGWAIRDPEDIDGDEAGTTWSQTDPERIHAGTIEAEEADDSPEPPPHFIAISEDLQDWQERHPLDSAYLLLPPTMVAGAFHVQENLLRNDEFGSLCRSMESALAALGEGEWQALLKALFFSVQHTAALIKADEAAAEGQPADKPTTEEG